MSASEAAFSPQDFDGFVFDLDGVLTDTATLHAEAWKHAFDEFLRPHAGGNSDRYRPFAIDPDYYRYVDGKPRYEGAASFVESRNIDIPMGTEDDGPGVGTVCGIANRKYELFLDLLGEGRLRAFDSSVRFVEDLRQAGLRTGVVSSSRNCVQVLAAAGLLELFDAKIDGRDVAERHLEGKPAPDIFSEAARALDIEPSRGAAVEDSIAGVESASAAGFGWVIGINRDAESGAGVLAEHGADRVVTDLAELGFSLHERAGTATPLDLEAMQVLARRLGTRTPALFLDYDGTLTPIVDHPDDATLSDDMRSVLMRLREVCVTAVISGRDLDDVRERVGLDGIAYAGSHGFDILLADGRREAPEPAQEARPALESAADELQRRLESIDGTLVEHKQFAVTVHFRLVRDEDLDAVEAAVDEVAAKNGQLRRRGGKKIIELLPDLDWDKGAALEWLLGVLEVDDLSAYAPVYVGDDTTDEDAFAVINDEGISVAVGRLPADTLAHFSVADTAEVRELLAWFCQRAAEAS